MLITIKNKTVLSTPQLLRHVLKFIYDEKNMSILEIRTMQESIVNWHEAIKLEEERLKFIQAGDIKLYGRPIITEHKYYEEHLQLESMAAMLRDNEEGELDRRKALFKEHGIDYRKFHRLPEAYVEEDFIRGQKLLEESNKREGIE